MTPRLPLSVAIAGALATVTGLSLYASGFAAFGAFIGSAGLILMALPLALNLSGASRRQTLPFDFTAMLDSVSDAFLLSDPNGSIVALNESACALFVYRREELLGQPVEALIPERFRDSHRRLRSGFQRAPHARPMGRGLELTALRGDGQEFRAEISLNPIQTAGGMFVAMNVRDVSEQQQFRRIRQHLSDILEATTDFVGMATPDHQVFYVNQAGRRMLGLNEDGELEPRPIPEFLMPDSWDELRNVALPTAERQGSWSGTAELRHREGQPIPVSQLILAHHGQDGRIEYYSTISRDIRNQRRSEEHLRRMNRTYAVLSACNQTLIRAEDEQRLIQDFCRIIADTGGYRFVWYGAAAQDDGRSVLAQAHAGHEAGYLQTANITWSDDERGQGPVGTAIRTGRPVIARDTRTDAKFAPWREEAAKRGYHSVAALPLKDEHGRCFASLNIYAGETDVFDADEMRLLTELADDLAFGIRSLQTRLAHAAAESTLLIRNRVIEVSRNGIMICDVRQPNLPLIYVNPAFEEITGYGAAEVLGRNPEFLAGQDTSQANLEAVRAALHQGREASVLLRNYRKDGSLFWSDLYVAPVRGETGEITHYAGIISDATERKAYEEQLEYQANNDQLTGLPNRNLMQDRLHQLLSYSARHQRLMAVLFLDIDQFKFVNDSLGHRQGDELVKVIATRLQDCTREGDTLARYGGDEFVLLMSDLDAPEEIALIAARMLKAISQPIELGEHSLQVSVSIGASLFPRDGRDADTLLRNADAAMYRAKELGRNNLQFYTTELNQRAMERITLEADLRRAIERSELVLHYQPQLDLLSGTVTGMEALVRWQHPGFGMVSPGRFIPLAEETGLIVPLGEWVLRSACEQQRAWKSAGLPPVAMAVNVSARQLAHPDFHAQVRAVIASSGIDPQELELELTESAIMADPETMLGRIRALKELGVRLSIDDFGTGYSSLSYLSNFPFDKLKIDKSFIRNVTTTAHDAEIVLAIIAMAHSLKLKVIAEGVETEGQLRYLARNGCDEMQGYYFSPALPQAEIADLLRDGRRIDPTLDETSSSPTLLLVDDEPNVLESLQRVLHRDGYNILTASGPREGFEVLARHPVDLIISDQRMPEMTGVEFLSRVRELHPAAVRMVLSAYADLETVIEAFNRGHIYKFLAKPWDNAALREEVREALMAHRNAPVLEAKR